MRTLISAAALLVAAGSANAAITGATWASVNNSASPYAPFAAPSTDGVGGGLWSNTNKTFDLFITGGVGDAVNAVDLGSATTFIEIAGGTTFNHPIGGDSRSFNTESFFAALPFDTFFTFGGNATTNGSFGGFAGASSLTGAGGKLTGTPFAPAGTPATIGADGKLWVMRVTVTSSTTALGGGLSKIGVGTPGGVLFFNVGNALVPTPGAVALFGLAGIAGVRRRR